MLKAGRGYIIRLHNERNNKSYFFARDDLPTFRFNYAWNMRIDNAIIYTSHKKVIKKIKSINIMRKNVTAPKQGYLYISKVFYKYEDRRGLRITKLTKPDKYDFLNAI